MSNNNQQLPIPNLPGTVRAQDNWIHLQKFGFRKGVKGSDSPLRSSNQVSSSGYFPDNLDYTSTRPSTAGAAFSERRTGADTTGARPSSAGGGRPNSSTLSFSFAQGAPAATRPQTAGASLGRSAAFGSGVYTGNVPKSLLGASSREPITQSAPFIPKYVETDKLVARFHAHFFQPRAWENDSPIGNPTIELTIGRRLTVLYYISDDTLELIEEKTQNTGFQGGNFFKRGVLRQMDGRPILLRDLAPGNSIRCLGVEIFITDADPFTREYFRRELKLILGPALPRPEIVREDLGAQYATGLGLKVPKRDKAFGTCSTDYLANKVGLDKTYQFLKYEGKVLTFHCFEIPKHDPFSDKPPISPESFVPTSGMRKYILLYYLSDNKVEVRALKGAGEEAKILLKKNKLPMNWRDVQRGSTPIYFEPSDFSCGNTIDIYGRVFLLVSCDEFTRQMLEEMGLEQFEVPVQEEVIEPIQHPIPMLGDGFLPIGRPEDTLATVYGMPKAIKSTKTVLKNQNRLLRARVKLLTSNKIDSSRSFQLSFYLEDNTLQVFEEVKRNSGIVGGNFLKRGRYTNTSPPNGEEPRYFVATDVFLGNIICVNGLEFQIIEMDNMSLLFCEAFPEEFPMFDTFKIVHTLVQKAIASRIDLHKEFSALDINNTGWVDRNNFIKVLDALKLSRNLNDQELLTLVRRFKEGDKYMYIEMADLFSHIYFLHNLRLHKTFVPNAITDMNSLFVTARSRSTQWRRVLRKDGETMNGNVRLLHLMHIFRKHGLNVPPNLKHVLHQQFGIRGPAAEAMNKILTDRHMHRDHHKDVRRIVSHADAARADVRSRGRISGMMTQASYDEGSESEEDEGMKRLAKRRDSFSKVSSVMRPFEKKSRPASPQVPIDDEATWIVNYTAICDQIYICDWKN